MNDKRIRTLLVLWLAFLMSPVMQVFVLQQIAAQGGEKAPLPFPPEIFQVAAGIIAALVFYNWRRALSPECLRKNGTTETAIVQSFTIRHIILYVLAESVGLIGFWVGLATKDPSLGYLHYGISVFLLALMYPRADRLEAAIRNRP